MYKLLDLSSLRKMFEPTAMNDQDILSVVRRSARIIKLKNIKCDNITVLFQDEYFTYLSCSQKVISNRYPRVELFRRIVSTLKYSNLGLSDVVENEICGKQDYLLAIPNDYINYILFKHTTKVETNVLSQISYGRTELEGLESNRFLTDIDKTLLSLESTIVNGVRPRIYLYNITLDSIYKLIECTDSELWILNVWNDSSNLTKPFVERRNGDGMEVNTIWGELGKSVQNPTKSYIDIDIESVSTRIIKQGEVDLDDIRRIILLTRTLDTNLHQICTTLYKKSIAASPLFDIFKTIRGTLIQ